MKNLFTNPIKIYVISAIIFIIIFIISESVFIVQEISKAVVFQFGEAVRVIHTPGLRFKLPFIQNKVLFDDRILNINFEAKELTASDGKRILVDAFLKFKISDPVIFFKTVFNLQGMEVRLNRIMESSMRKIIGKVPLNALLSEKRAKLMNAIKDSVDSESKNFGIEIIDVRILKSDLPSENASAIYRRMQTEREKEAKQIRAEGVEEGQKIRSKADKEVTILLSNAYMEAQKIKAAGDQEAAKIYNTAYSKDPEFYVFYKTILAYETAFKENTSFILSPKSSFLKYFRLD